MARKIAELRTMRPERSSLDALASDRIPPGNQGQTARHRGPFDLVKCVNGRRTHGMRPEDAGRAEAGPAEPRKACYQRLDSRATALRRAHTEYSPDDLDR